MSLSTVPDTLSRQATTLALRALTAEPLFWLAKIDNWLVRLSVEITSHLTHFRMSIHSMEAYRALRSAVSEALYQFAEGRMEEAEAARLITEISLQHWFRQHKTKKRAQDRKRLSHR